MFGLAERLGCTVSELGARMSLAELREWLAYDRLASRSINPDGSAKTHWD